MAFVGLDEPETKTRRTLHRDYRGRPLASQNKQTSNEILQSRVKPGTGQAGHGGAKGLAPGRDRR